MNLQNHFLSKNLRLTKNSDNLISKEAPGAANLITEN